MSTVYLLHFNQPIAPGRHTCQHYIGVADDLQPRIWAHLHGHDGARLTQVAKERGIGFTVARTWDGGRKLERKLKNRHDGPRLCPICSGRHPVQLGLLPEACAFIPAIESAEAQHCAGGGSGITPVG